MTDRTDRIAELADRARQLQTELNRLTEDLSELASEPAALQRRAITPSLLTPEEAAEALAVGRSRVFDLIKSGELDSLRIGSSRRVPVSAIDAYVARLTGAA